MLTGRAQRPGRQVQAQGRAHRRGGRRRRRHALQGLEPGARGRARHQARAHHARHHHAAGLRHQPAGGHGHRAPRSPPARSRAASPWAPTRPRTRRSCSSRSSRSASSRSQNAKSHGRAAQGVQGLLAGRAGAAAAHRRRAAHRPLHGPARRADGAGVEDHARRAGPARLREPPEGRRGLPLGLHGRPRRAVRRRVPRQQPARGHQPREDRAR